MGASKQGVPVVIPSDVWQPLMEIRAQLDSDCPGAPTPIEELLREVIGHYERCDRAAGEAEDFCKRAQAWKKQSRGRGHKERGRGGYGVPTAEVGGVSLYYEERGTGEPVVFVHGIPTDHRAWAAQGEEFSQGRRMIALSRRYAFPNSRQGDVTDSTVQNNAADLRGIIEGVAGGAVDLVGHSYGGFISAYLAADHGDLVRSLVLVEPAISTLLVADQASGAQVLGLLLRSPSVALSGRRFQSRSLAPSLRALEAGDVKKATELNVDGVQNMRGAFAKLPEETRKMMLDNAKTIAELKTAFPRFTDKDAAKIACPTLVVNGESSALWLRRIGELMGRAVPGAKSARIQGARHFPHMENPGEFNRTVLEFLRGMRSKR